MFQNLYKLMSDAYPNDEKRNAPRKVGKWIQWIPLINEIFKLNFDGSKINNISASR